MKYISWAFFVMLLVGCKSKKNANTSAKNTPTQEVETFQEEKRLGIVRLNAKEGCPVLIELNEPIGEDTYLIPVSFDEGYKQEGLHIEFRYSISRAHTGDCHSGIPAVLRDLGALE